jgi:serine/threonine-protein kinase
VPQASTARVSLPDRYRVVRHLANGGMASVWEAHDQLLDRSVAVKVLAPHLGEDDRARARFQREARAAAGLSTLPNVVTIYDVGEHDGRGFMVMELMRGGSVADRLRSGGTRSGDGREARARIPRETALRWLGEAAAAIDAAHEAGVVHRDIKPANMLLDERDRLAIADFGIARVAESTSQLTQTGQVLGTAAYISPEQAMGEPATAASDRYAFAVVAYELLTGTRPFNAEHFAAQARAHVEDDPTPPTARLASLPRAVDGVLLRGLAKAPEDRWPTAAAMVEELDRALDPGPPTADTRPIERTTRAPAPAPAAAAPAAAGARPARQPRRFGGAAALIALALIVLVAVLLVVLLSGGGSNAPTAASHKKHRAAKTPTATPTKTATATSTPTPTPTPTATAPAGSGTSLSRARTLQQQGFAAGNAGDFTKDLALSQQALKACGGTHALDPCGYADYEVGRSLNHLGQPAQAIPYLQKRLAYGGSDLGVVQAELASAESKLNGGGPGKKGPGKGKGKGKG